ncbi:LytTR family DNA-binding domain-containing protein [Urechidicola croceus]|uniref:HTH LytTR-type domain-containing protein n=1 Tax=Urechidicola croceus TaxID=1850246 RepID=A0A1D8P9Q4_9FLAO|nr:LytTR family DNA-binding domain-containing protein [Urechidicola croceus]AOW21327.1 hypothetical protein LPB138_11835 [Urechidicola croceus]
MPIKFSLDKNRKHHLWIAIGLGVWVFIFLFLSEPFDINKFSQKEKFVYLPIYGFIQSICYLLILPYQEVILKKQNSWLLKNELFLLLLLSIIGSIINFFFYKYIIVNNEPHTYEFIHYQKFVYLPALTIILPFVFISRYILGKFSDKSTFENKITIQGDGQYDFIHLNSDDLLFIQSSDNYIEINYLEKSGIKKKLIRGKLSDVSNKFPKLLKTHRSYLINPIHFKQLKIENKKHFLDLGYGDLIPVSRALQSEVKSQLQLTTNR